MDKTDIKNRQVVVILDKKCNNGLISALFYTTDPTKLFFAQHYYFEPNNNTWFQLVTSYTFQKYSRGMFNRLLLFNKSFVTEVLKLSDYYERVFIFVNNALFQGPGWYGTEFKTIKRQRPNVYFVFYFIDIINSRHSRKAMLLIERCPKLFDLVYTSDINDAQTNNLIYYPLPYACSPSAYVTVSNCYNQKDLSFCANIKGRSGMILEVLKDCKSNNISVSMALLPNSEYEKQLFSEYNSDVEVLNRFVNYDETLKYTLTTECILDIVQDGQTALSMRPYEAVVFNKKLLTNNPSIFSFKYYNPNYMQFFSQPRDIDWDWVKKRIAVDYQYKGDFSPLNLWKDMENRLK